jgi:hypothetical protein
MVGLVLASFTDVFQSILGVLFALCGLGLLLMGLIALSDREWRHGGAATLFGLLLSAAGMWLVGILG